MYRLIITLSLSFIGVIAMSQQKGNGFQFVEKKDNKEVAVMFNNQLLTAYCYYDSSRKPVLFPVNTVDGITVTRSYPFAMIPGERIDHPHHTGIWFNYESVNGLDFWNNSTAIPLDRRHRYGTIRHQMIVDKKAAGNEASLTTASEWVRPDNKAILNETTKYWFSVKENDFIIDYTTTLTARDTAVVFKDVKDGLLAIRVARELEMPSKDATGFVDENGKVSVDRKVNNEGVTGMYYSSEGLKGDDVWGTKGSWVMLTGRKENKDVTIGIIDHPSNVGYPAFWHARGYGLFAVNPLGRKVFSNGKEKLNFTLQPGQSATFKYRILIHSGKMLSKDDMNKLASGFASK